jgi:hypothetical protein
MFACVSRPTLLPVSVALAALAAMVLAPAAQGELLAPHVDRPEAVTPHLVNPAATPDSATVPEPEESPESAVAGASRPTGASLPSVADSPDGDGPASSPEAKPCKPKPGHICPYFCPEGALTTTCTKPPVLPNWVMETHEVASMREWMETLHFCAGNRLVAFMVDFYVDVAYDSQLFSDLKEFRKLSEKSKLLDRELWEAYNMYVWLDCVNLVEV